MNIWIYEYSTGESRRCAYLVVCKGPSIVFISVSRVLYILYIFSRDDPRVVFSSYAY